MKKKLLILGGVLLMSIMSLKANEPTHQTTFDENQQPITENPTTNLNTIHPLEPLLQVIIYVESKGYEKAYNANGDCVGLLQITKILVRECNNILKKNGSTKRYSYEDRWDRDKSIEMFYLVQEYHNPTYDIDKAIRLWNKSTKYMKKVKSILEK